MRVSMEGKGTPKNEQNQFCHSPAVKAMTREKASLSPGVQQKNGIRKKNLVNGRRHLFRLPEGMEQA